MFPTILVQAVYYAPWGRGLDALGDASFPSANFRPGRSPHTGIMGGDSGAGKSLLARGSSLGLSLQTTMKASMSALPLLADVRWFFSPAILVILMSASRPPYALGSWRTRRRQGRRGAGCRVAAEHFDPHL